MFKFFKKNPLPDSPIENLAERIGQLAGDSVYVREHLRRYIHTLTNMPRIENGKALELGSSLLFPAVMMDDLGYATVDVSVFNTYYTEKNLILAIPNDVQGRMLSAYNVNLESEAIPCADQNYDLVVCCEVIEHLELDPMYMMAEINRVLRKDGLLLLTTPNCVSARNVMKIIEGEAPHFFMKYSKSREYYRHNIEYSPGQVMGLVKAAGFEVVRIWTENSFSDKVPEIDQLLAKVGGRRELRGDNIFCIARKSGPVADRFPAQIYF